MLPKLNLAANQLVNSVTMPRLNLANERCDSKAASLN